MRSRWSRWSRLCRRKSSARTGRVGQRLDVGVGDVRKGVDVHALPRGIFAANGKLLKIRVDGAFQRPCDGHDFAAATVFWRARATVFLPYQERNVVIIGSGCAGNTAAIYTARANLKPLVVGGHEAGGQLSLTTLVENFPGFPEGVMGPVLVENMRKQAEASAPNVHGAVLDTDFSTHPLRINIEGEWTETRTVIIASGASARWLGIDSEQSLIGRGVSSCATCDGFFYRGKKIMVIGGGDSAMEEANFLTRFGSEVTVVHRRGEFRASKIMLDRAQRNPKVKFLRTRWWSRSSMCR